MTGQLCFANLNGSKLQAFLTRFPTAADSEMFRCQHCRFLFFTETDFSRHCEAEHYMVAGFDEGLVEKRLKEKVFVCNMCIPKAPFDSTSARSAHQHAVHRRMLQGN